MLHRVNAAPCRLRPLQARPCCRRARNVYADVWFDVIAEHPAAVLGLSEENRSRLDAVLPEEVAAPLSGG